jgi:hypothetical protein
VLVRRCSLLARRNDDWADTCVLLLGLEGKAGSTVSLDDEWVVVGADAGAAAPAETTVNEKEKLASDSEKPVAQSESMSDEGLSLIVKLLLGGAIVAACVVFIKAYASRRQAGSRGVYEKVEA